MIKKYFNQGSKLCWYLKLYIHVLLFVCLQTSLLNLDWFVLTIIFLPKILMYRRGNFVYHDYFNLRDPMSMNVLHTFDSHSGTLSDFDMNGHHLVTCGFARRHGNLQAIDRFLMVYDLRYNLLLHLFITKDDVREGKKIGLFISLVPKFLYQLF